MLPCCELCNLHFLPVAHVLSVLDLCSADPAQLPITAAAEELDDLLLIYSTVERCGVINSALRVHKRVSSSGETAV